MQGFFKTEKKLKYAIGLRQQLSCCCGVTGTTTVWEICNLCLIEFIAPLSERERREEEENFSEKSFYCKRQTHVKSFTDKIY